MSIPRLHLVTNDEIVNRPAFVSTAVDLLLNLQQHIALHVRAKQLPARQVFDIVEQLLEKAEFVRALLVVNDRVDIALTNRVRAVQLGARSLPVGTVRAMGGTRLLIGYSAHAPEEAAAAEREGADFVFAGSIYPTTSHLDVSAGGARLLSSIADSCSKPVFAIGGVTPERISEVLSTGAYGVAVISAVWHAPDPVHAAHGFVKMLEE